MAKAGELTQEKKLAMKKARHPHPRTAHPTPRALSQGQLELTGATVAGAEGAPEYLKVTNL